MKNFRLLVASVVVVFCLFGAARVWLRFMKLWSAGQAECQMTSDE